MALNTFVDRLIFAANVGMKGLKKILINCIKSVKVVFVFQK